MIFLRHISHLLFAAIFLALTTNSLWAQQSLTVSGTVFDDANSEPLMGATVVGNDGEAAKLTDDAGKYTLVLTIRDTVLVRVSYIGYEPRIIKLVKPAKAVIKLDISMKPEGVQSDEVVITTTAKGVEQRPEDITVSVESLRPKNIDLQASSDISKALEQTPGVSVTGGQINIRGSSGYAQGSGTRVLMLLNGLPLIAGDGGDARFEMLPSDNIQNIEVIKGASSVLYGTGALGGVINVITANPEDKPKTTIRARAQVFDTPADRRADWDYTSAAYNLGLHLMHSRRIKKNFDFTVMGDLWRNSGYRQSESVLGARAFLMMKYNFPKIQGLSIGLNAMYAYDSTGTFLGWRNDSTGKLMPGQTMNLNTGEYASTLFKSERHNLTIDPYITYVSAKGHVHSYRGRVFMNYTRNSDPTQNVNFVQAYNEYIYTHRFRKYVTLISGVSHNFNNIASDSIYGQAVSHNLGVFLQAELKVGRLNLSAGGRYQFDHIANKTQNFSAVVVNQPIFRFGANFRFHKATYLRASFGQGLRNPSIRERFIRTVQGGLDVVPNPNIKVEGGYNTEVGIKQLFMSPSGNWKGMFDIAGFYMKFNDMVEFSVDPKPTGGSQVSFINVSNATIYGLEASIFFKGRIGRMNVEGNGSYTFINPLDLNGNKQLDGDFVPDSVLGRILALDPSVHIQDRPYFLKYRSQHMLRFGMTLEYRKVALTANVRYNSRIVNVDKLLALDLPSVPAPGSGQWRRDHQNGWVLLDLVLAANLPKSTVSLHVFNLLNTEYMTVPGLMGEQRSFAIQYKVTI